MLDRLGLRLRAARVGAAALVSAPEPRRIGQYARGRQMLAGNFLVAGDLIRAEETVPFAAPHPDAVDELHSFDWLDHLAAVGDQAARGLAQKALGDWLAQFGRGAGPGWVPGLAGRRVMAWLAHAVFLMQGMTPEAQRSFLAALALHADYLARRAAHAAPGLPRIEAQSGLLHAALALEGRGDQVTPATASLMRATEALIEADGGIATRNPEDLLRVFELLSWAGEALHDQGRAPAPALLAALDKIAGALRVLRHADGGLARFHGGGRGAEGVLDAALAAHIRLGRSVSARLPDQAMGYVRLAAGRCTVIADAAPPPLKAAPGRAHAATLAFELTSNRRPVVVSCGDGFSFGPDWHRASRATASHSTLAFEGYSSARFASGAKARLDLADGPRHVGVEFRHAAHARAVSLSHDGYAASHGLEHLRYLDLSADGRVLSGVDSLVAADRVARKRFDAVMARMGGAGLPFALRFHLHPETEASLDLAGTAVSVALRSGEIWVFRAEGRQIGLAPSVYLEKGRLKPRPSQQIVLSLRATGYTTQLNWSFAKAQETPLALRDLVQDNPMALFDGL